MCPVRQGSRPGLHCAGLDWPEGKWEGHEGLGGQMGGWAERVPQNTQSGVYKAHMELRALQMALGPEALRQGRG